MLRTRWLVPGFSALLLGILMVSCGGLGSYAAALDGTNWTLESINGAQPLASTTVTLTFDSGTVGGSGGCNSYGGGFTATVDTLLFSNLSSTEMACETAIMAQEAAFFVALGSEVTYQRSDASLGLTSQANGQVLVFVPTVTDSAALP